MSNQEWKSPGDEDARIAKMKDGRTHLAHKAEHAVDLDTGAVVCGDAARGRPGRHDNAG
jgi:transposase